MSKQKTPAEIAEDQVTRIEALVRAKEHLLEHLQKGDDKVKIAVEEKQLTLLKAQLAEAEAQRDVLKKDAALTALKATLRSGDVKGDLGLGALNEAISGATTQLKALKTALLTARIALKEAEIAACEDAGEIGRKNKILAGLQQQLRLRTKQP